jgi:hypothetical protein
MTYIAIQENLNGKQVDWMEKVSDEQYSKQTMEATIKAYNTQAADAPLPM